MPALSLHNKIVAITGASSGIGAACAQQFAMQGARLILTARRLERLEKLCRELHDQYHIETLALQCDVQNKEQVAKTFQQLPAAWQEIDILVNNAGLSLTTDKIQEGNIENWDIMLNTNVHGLLYVTHAILPGMVARNRGHIFNLGSISGRDCYPGGNVYCATKFAVRAISQSLRLDLLGSAIRVTEIDPGAVETEFSEIRWNDVKRAKEFYRGFTPLVADDIADTIVYCATRPLHVNVAEIVICPTEQASITHTFRRT